MVPRPSFWWATWAVPMGTSCLKNTLWSLSLQSSRPCWASEWMDWPVILFQHHSKVSVTHKLMIKWIMKYCYRLQQNKTWETITSVILQGCHLPEGLCGRGGRGCLRQPRRWICHPAGEPPLPRRWGGKRQRRLRKQGHSPNSLLILLENSCS